MEDGLFRVIFIGELVEAEKRDVVKRNLATLFGSTTGSLERLFVDKPIVLKKNLMRDEAIRFRDAIIRCGAFCRIETMDTASEAMAILEEDQPGEHITCPRCGQRQTKSSLCRYCGALVQEYRQVDQQDTVQPKQAAEEINRRYYERRRDLETAVNVDDRDERRRGRDRRRAHLNWRM